MIEQQIIIFKKFKDFKNRLNELAIDIERSLNEQQEKLDEAIAEDPELVLKLMKKGKASNP